MESNKMAQNSERFGGSNNQKKIIIKKNSVKTSTETRDHSFTIEEYIEFLKDDKFTIAYRKLILEELESALDRKLLLKENQDKQFTNLHDQNILVKFRGKTIYIAPNSVMISGIIILSTFLLIFSGHIHVTF